MENNNLILEINNLQTSFFTDDGEVKAVDGVTLKVQKGETLGVVGESGCGKSVMALSVMRLIQKPGKITGGEIILNGQNIVKKTEKEMLKIRGNKISFIFQEPMTSLNPVLTIGEQLRETFRAHNKISKKEALAKSIEILKLVKIPSPEKRIHQYPYELSGGMRQRVMIAMALACNPELLIADEPTTALDVTIQAQILELIKDLQSKLNTAVVMITHDLGVVAETCNNVAVMYCGSVVEYADVKTLFATPKHPYTLGLFNSLPRHDIDKEELEAIKGSVPNLTEIPNGCRFSPRCPYTRDICKDKFPELISTGNSQVRCWAYSDEWKGKKGVL
ncbi:ABC transporter ATP-binding protein [Dethiobacter alkaliphilus]|uniref:Oligopeptide/dipeptide ABC transporter, ATPase subunit n=1 Tax=Dethiobacter alkaliphilus AHT 1 TaxID=555088 RepID=C0GID4_DETAL|nr:ABC transporter ATP-binding protein [Dethiobacter alkaliphilus]EEG76982.1 oligopeptide/dipeptide ABC transporter, ATPase subunit [Dethiobacter alkaliphilus AHT 1]